MKMKEEQTIRKLSVLFCCLLKMTTLRDFFYCTILCTSYLLTETKDWFIIINVIKQKLGLYRDGEILFIPCGTQ